MASEQYFLLDLEIHVVYHVTTMCMSCNEVLRVRNVITYLKLIFHQSHNVNRCEMLCLMNSVSQLRFINTSVNEEIFIFLLSLTTGLLDNSKLIFNHGAFVFSFAMS